MKGRPSIFTEDMANEILQRIREGESVRQICMLEHMPAQGTFYRWLTENEELQEKYARAKADQADYFAEEMIDISDEGRNDWEERENQRTGHTYIALNEEAIARSRLRIETRKWLMGKMKPKKYGDKLQQEITGKDGEALVPAAKVEITEGVVSSIIQRLRTEI